MAIGDSNNEAGCTTPGSPKCILDKYYGVSTDNEWMMDMELYYYQQAYPEYDVNSDAYLDNIGKLIVNAPKLRADCAGGSFWSCFAMAVMGGIGTTFVQPVIIRPAEPAPQNYGDYADPDCPGCGYTMSVPRLPEALSGGSADTYVYIGYRESEPVYVGITNNPATRQSAHGDRFTIVPINTTPVTRGQARAIEQALIVQNPQFENINNSISPNHSYYQDAVDWGNWWLAQSGRNP